MSQRLLLYLGICHSPRIVILLVSGLREWDLVRVGIFPRGCSPPNPFGGSFKTRQNLFTPHHILEWGAKTCLRTCYWLYELPSGSRNHILELREKRLFYQFSSYMSYATFTLT